jgi:DNA-directed RNA polymerase subunit RPC12/RpoP
MINCSRCGEEVNPLRAAWLEEQDKPTTCMPCGEKDARMVKFGVVPMHKGHYFPIFDFNKEDLIGINNKGGLVK